MTESQEVIPIHMGHCSSSAEIEITPHQYRGYCGAWLDLAGQLRGGSTARTIHHFESLLIQLLFKCVQSALGYASGN